MILIVDGSALYFAIRELFGDEQLDYDKMVEFFSAYAPVGATPQKVRAKLFYTSSSPSNIGQNRFLDKLKNGGWTIRSYPVSQVGLVDQRTMSMVQNGPVKDRLMRFDAQIAYVIGDLASQGESLIVVSDSFNLAEPLSRAKRLADEVEGGSDHTMSIAFFSGLIDSRWQKAVDVNVIHMDKLIPNEMVFTFPVDDIELQS